MTSRSPIETNNVVERLHAYDVPNSGSRDGQEFLDQTADLIQSLSDRIDVLEGELIKCRTQFLEYERHHRDEAERLMLERDTSKVAVARLAKAARNREMADMIDASLTQGGKNV